MPLNRLAPGVEIVTVPGRGLALRTPEGDFLRIDTGEVPERELLERLAGDGEGTSGPARDDSPLASLVEAFEGAGFVRRADAEISAARPLAGCRVLVLGDEVIVGVLARCVEAAGGDVDCGDAVRVAAMAREGAGGDGRRTAVVWCLDDPVPPGLWEQADRLPGRGIAWLRCHREGRQAWIEPPAAVPGDVTSADVRLRRLAATPAYRELAAYWSGQRTPESARLSTPASAGLIAGLLADDLITWATGRVSAGTLPARRRLRRIDLADLTVTEHPVLPVPVVAELPGAVGARAGVGVAAGAGVVGSHADSDAGGVGRAGVDGALGADSGPGVQEGGGR